MRKYKVVDLFGNEEERIISGSVAQKKSIFTDYEGFVDKFKPKKTTDDCYTPKEVYEAVLNYVKKYSDLSDKEILRPFYPGGDYEAIDYKANTVVIDNPPFSILSKILDFYLSNSIQFFLFATHLTNFSIYREGLTHIIASASITYENGAKINTSFLTNMAPFNQYKIIGSVELNRSIKEACTAVRELASVPRIKYKYPDELITAAMIGTMVESGAEFKVPHGSCKHVRDLASLKRLGKKLFGAGYLISKKLAQEKAVQEKAIVLELSEKEREIVWSLREI